jgi:hypothetical protein
MDDIADMAASKDAVVMIFSMLSKTRASAFSQAMKFSAVIPASGFLTKVPSKGSLIPKLWACHL